MNIFGGMINDCSLFKGVKKPRMTLSINRRGYPALLYFTLIALISMLKFDARCPEIVFCLYLIGILETQSTASLFFFDIPVLLLHFHCSK